MTRAHIDRRQLLRGFTGIAAGLLIPPTVVENAEAARRVWTLDHSMLGGPRLDPELTRISTQYYPHVVDFYGALFAGAMTVTPTDDDHFLYTWTFEGSDARIS